MKRSRTHHLAAGAAALVLTASFVAGCSPDGDPSTPAARRDLSTVGTLARSYVHLVLALGVHDPHYVDAFYGPEEWRRGAENRQLAVNEIRQRAEALLAEVRTIPAPAEELARLRRDFLRRHLEALLARCEMLIGRRFQFDEESQALYGATAPLNRFESFDAVLQDLDRRLREEGFARGSMAERYDAFRQQFVIPAERLPAVFSAAIEACRERTLRHLRLPAGESFEVEYVSGKPWGAYNWYQGAYKSLIQVNTDLPTRIDEALELACHEGYPGHHVYNTLLEMHLMQERGWVEFSVYPLFSPQSLVAEGSANLGTEMAFPDSERLGFESQVLFPLAGLDPSSARILHEVLELSRRLEYAGIEIARRYLDGELDPETANDWLARYQLLTPERAAQRLRFIDRYRSYVINYSLGRDLVREYLEALGANPEDPVGRWRELERLLSSPAPALQPNLRLAK